MLKDSSWYPRTWRIDLRRCSIRRSPPMIRLSGSEHSREYEPFQENRKEGGRVHLPPSHVPDTGFLRRRSVYPMRSLSRRVMAISSFHSVSYVPAWISSLIRASLAFLSLLRTGGEQRCCTPPSCVGNRRPPSPPASPSSLKISGLSPGSFSFRKSSSGRCVSELNKLLTPRSPFHIPFYLLFLSLVS